MPVHAGFLRIRHGGLFLIGGGLAPPAQELVSGHLNERITSRSPARTRPAPSARLSGHDQSAVALASWAVCVGSRRDAGTGGSSDRHPKLSCCRFGGHPV